MSVPARAVHHRFTLPRASKSTTTCAPKKCTHSSGRSTPMPDTCAQACCCMHQLRVVRNLHGNTGRKSSCSSNVQAFSSMQP